MINPCYFTDESLETGFKNNLDRQNNNHTNSILSITPMYPDFGFEIRYNNKIKQEMDTIYGRLINQYKFLYHVLFSASFKKITE